jgi:hypothetical protein
LVDRLDARLGGRVLGDLEHADHLDDAVTALGHRGGLLGQDSASGVLGI